MRRYTTLAVLVVVVLAGCSGGAGGGEALSGDAGTQVDEAEAEATPAATEAADGAGGEAGGKAGEAGVAAPRVNRKLIRTGEITLRVEDFESARANLTRLARRSGGFVSESHRETEEVDNETFTRGTVVLRVPAGNFSTFFDRVAAQGNVIESRTRTRDVTEQLVDIEARLRNLRAQRDRLRELYNRSNDTEAILQVSRELSEVQGRIERLQARQRSLRRQVALSTVTVHLREPRPEPEFEPPEQWYDTPVLEAFLSSVDGAVVTLRALVVATAYVLPYAVVFGGPLAGVGLVLYRRRRGRYPWNGSTAGGGGGDAGDGGDAPPNSTDGDAGGSDSE